MDASVKARIDQCVAEIAAQGGQRITASAVANLASVAIEEARTRLLELVNDGQLTVEYEIECPGCARSIQSYPSVEDLPLGSQMICPVDETEFVLSADNIWVTFTPNRTYFGDPLKKKTA